MTRTVAVRLQNQATYVTGTINDAPVVWTNVADNRWEAVVRRSIDDTYKVHIVIVDGAGNQTESDFTLYYGLTLVIDRAESDLINETDKGFYQAEDMNRVGSAVQQIANRFNENGYFVEVNPKVDWTPDDEPTPEQFQHYLDEVALLRDVYQSAAGMFPELPVDTVFLTYEEANNIEKILMMIDQMITKMMKVFWYSGELYSGEV